MKIVLLCVGGGGINLWWGNRNLVGSQCQLGGGRPGGGGGGGGGIFLGGRNEQILGSFGEIPLIPMYGKPCYYDFSVKNPRY